MLLMIYVYNKQLLKYTGIQDIRDNLTKDLFQKIFENVPKL
jgi:hypothetical protein